MREESDTTFEERLKDVRHRIARAAERAGRSPASVQILPVTKGHSPQAIRKAAEAGLGRIGENRVGEAEEKRLLLGGDAGVAWHLIGHLQRNKAARAVRIFDVVESVDSVRLAERLGKELEKAERPELRVLVEVNTSGEERKSGFDPAEVPKRVSEICDIPGLRVEGLMTMAPFTQDEHVLRTTFRRARQLLDQCVSEVEGLGGRVLSMGMTNDFELAVEEGSTRVRLGTGLFGERPKK